MELKQYFTKENLTFTTKKRMTEHTTIKVGGPAEVLVRPNSVQDIQNVLNIQKRSNAPFFVLGGGSNILVSDGGIDGIVMDMSAFTNIEILHEASQSLLHVGAGLSVTAAAEYAAHRGYAGIDFLYSMPGTIGGALWMNARCYGQEISEVLQSVTYMTMDGSVEQYHCKAKDFSYKHSPFQTQNYIILSCTIKLYKDNPEDIYSRMYSYRADREKKGHFMAPSAGSVFKNNPDFGAPSGVLIDTMNMRGMSRGDAQISDMHANILINRGNASAEDMLALIREIEMRIQKKYGITLEREILLVGKWNTKKKTPYK